MALGTGIGALHLAKGGHSFDKVMVVLHLPLGSVCLLFLLFGHLGSLPSYFPSTGQGMMGFTSTHGAGYFRVVRASMPN